MNENESQPTVLLKAQQVADRWGVPRATVYALVRSEKLPVIRLGKHMRWTLEMVEQFERGGGATS